MFCCSLQRKDIKQYMNNLLWMFDIEDKNQSLKLNTSSSFLNEQIPEINEWENISTPRSQ